MLRNDVTRRTTGGMAEKQDQLGTRLGERGLRTTKARLLILAHLAKRRDHPTADAILKTLHLEGHKLGPATLYQNLSRLAEAGLVARLGGPDGLMHFDPNVLPHPHLVCKRCGQIVDAKIDNDIIDRLAPTCPHLGHTLSTWQLEDVELELKGICPDCQ